MTSKAHRDPNAAQRAVQALSLRSGGATYAQIAQQCGYSDKAVAYNAVQRELKRALLESVEQLRQIDGERLDALTRAIYPRALRGELQAIDRVLRLMERRAKLLGIDVQPDAGAFPAQVVIREYPAGIAEGV